MDSKLRCTLFPGQFSSELVVVVTSASGREYSLFAPKIDIEYQEMPTENNPVQGWLEVDVIECDKGRCLVRLPQTTLENGQYITVAESQLNRVNSVIASS